MNIADRVLARLQHIARTDGGHESAPEIAEALQVSTGSVRATLGQLESDGTAQKSGVSSTGARCWTTTAASQIGA